MALNLKNAFYTDLLPHVTSSDKTYEFVKEICQVMLEFIEQSFDRSTRVVEFAQPDELASKMDFTLRDGPVHLQQIVHYCRQALQYSVKTGHPYFFNQLFAGIDVVSLMGDCIASAANASMYTYEVGPVFVLMENEVLKKMMEFIGYTSGDGILAPGGSLSNMYALNAARFKMFPESKTKGIRHLPPLVCFTSREGHYSMKKGAALLGLGTDSIIPVETDDTGSMNASDLRTKVVDAKAKGLCPFIVNATSGTTVRGAFDPLNAIADICQEFNMWLHIDAAWGGACLLSKTHRHLMNGSERADSITWNPHKLMGVPLQCSAFITKHTGLLKECNSTHATYLFQQDKKQYDVSYDTGDKAIQCGRHNDVLKLWLTWKAQGHCGYEQRVDKAFDNAKYLTEQIVKRTGFELVSQPLFVNVCFWYYPVSMRHLPDGPEKTEKLHRVGPEVKKRMTEKGSLLLGYQPVKDKCNSFRMIVHSSAVGHADMDYVLDEIERLAADLTL
ncbi:glutamate decarboxylase 1-like [Corticium candelabrum]|uniref:glutamate decarboxylase 1-like n=1 Tax=Corticium candelabrum TaxID=121492 RepID=UPI002E266758|nr:glutamate decarboxylase 1-like [Corticium candelabrum]